ncbi:MAG: hypothetical protein JWN65_195 [Solirubrobacterales bacterium]|nr:hypothetical protein [Solirubrobacterales bacterium]
MTSAALVNQQTAATIVTGLLFLGILELVRRKHLMERYALLWLVATSVMLVMAAWSQPLTAIASLVGIYYAPSALFALAFAFMLLLLVHFSLAVSQLSDRSTRLAQQVAILQHQIDAERGASRGAPPGPDDGEPAVGPQEGDRVPGGDRAPAPQ